jgi:glycosyltransferase involved in cell wall biosynthesis
MKILFQYYSGGGGALENIKVLLLRLAKDNPQDEIVIVCNQESKLNELEIISNITIVNPKEFFHKELTRLYLGFWGLKKLVKELGPDIVWSMNLGSYVKLNAINILSVNNSHQVYPLAYTQSHPKSRLSVIIMRFFFRLSLKVADRVITQTEVIKSYIERLAPNKNISVISKVVENIEDIKEKPIPSDVMAKLLKIKSKVKMLYVATNYHHKNHKVIIDATVLLVKEKKNVCLILSLTEQEVIDIGGDAAANLIDSNHICCVGWVNKEWLKPLYDFTNLCLMPSILESLSSAHLEAMAWGVPQISSDLEFARETCRDASLYCSPFNAQEWCDAIVKLINTPELSQKLMNKGYKRINDFPKNWHQVAMNYCKIFENELRKRT